jgi:hypothetical protein
MCLGVKKRHKQQVRTRYNGPPQNVHQEKMANFSQKDMINGGQTSEQDYY